MDDLIIVRRLNGKYCSNKPTIKLEMNGNRFVFSKQTMDNLKLKHESKVMFGFNYKEKKAYIFIENEEDSFVLKAKGGSDPNLRFTSIDLMNHFINCFQIDDGLNKYYFDVAEKINEKGAYQITYK